jgi:hypothetical protein
MNCELMLTCDTPAYMSNVNKNQLSRQTGSRNLTGPKTLPTIWHTYMKLVTKYQISAINSCWEKFDEKYLRWMEGWTDGKTDRSKTVYPPPLVERGYNNSGFTKTTIWNDIQHVIYREKWRKWQYYNWTNRLETVINFCFRHLKSRKT